MKKIGYSVLIVQKNGNVAKYFTVMNQILFLVLNRGKMKLMHIIFWGKEINLCIRIQIL